MDLDGRSSCSSLDGSTLVESRRRGGFFPEATPAGGSQQRHRARRWRLAVLLAAIAASACRGDLGRCERLVSEERHREAADLCEEVYAASADPRAGLAAARARGALGELSAVRDWAGRLAGTAQEATAWGLAARLHMQRGEPDAATAAFSRSLELQRAAGAHAEAAKSLYGLFYVAWDEGRHRKALLFAHQSAAEAAAAGDPALQWTALGGVFTAHYELGDLDGAERVVEAARELSLPESRAYVFSYLGTLRLDQDRPALARDALETVLEPGAAAERAEALYELLPAIRESPATAPRPLDEVLAASRGRQVLIYFRAGDALWRIAVTDGRIAHQRLAVPAAEVAQLAGRWLADPADLDRAAQLGDLLLPQDPLLRELLVAADRPLDGLPFAALRRRGRWLVEDHEIAYVPGLNALAVLREPRSAAPGRPVVLGDPHGDLDAAAREAREVAAQAVLLSSEAPVVPPTGGGLDADAAAALAEGVRVDLGDEVLVE